MPHELQQITGLTCGQIDETITPTMPAHWLAENLERERPTPAFPATVTAASNGSIAEATSAPNLNTDSAAFDAILVIRLLSPITVCAFFLTFSPLHDNILYNQDVYFLFTLFLD